ncbi:hypothetical protein D3C77_370390 [compost metagenome]
MLQLQYFTEERHFVLRRGRVRSFFIRPVGGNPVFRSPVHFLRTDLNLSRLSSRAHNGGMQRLIHIGLRHGDIVLKPPRHRLPKGMDNPQGSVTVFNIVYDNPNSQQIINFIKLLVLRRHLLVDAVDVFRTTRQLCFNAHLIQLLLNFGDDILNEFLPLSPLLVHQIGNPIILLRV